MKEVEKLKVLELFGGIGAIRKALINLDIPYEIKDYVEIDKACVKSYNSLYNENYTPKSVVGYKAKDEKIDVLIHGSPCQDFSRIGNKLGGIKNSGTRSSLLFETIRIVKEMKYKPKYIIWENVKGVLDKNMRSAFILYLKELESLGYQNKYEILNAKDFGVPQNRERIFVISKLNRTEFDFNNLEKTTSKPIKCFLDENVSELYTVRQKSILKYFNNKNHTFSDRIRIIDNYAYTITTKQVRLPNSGFISLGNNKYRYLTEKECLKLMGFDDNDYYKLAKTHNKQEDKMSAILYKQAGNSIVVNVLMAIIKEILKIEERKKVKETMNVFNELNNLYEERQEIENLKIKDLISYRNHPFHLYEGDRLEEMIKNIEENGVLQPIIVRYIDELEKYEILSGHNRVNALKILNQETVPAIVKENVSNEEAERIMIDTNLMQRSFNDLSISEKAEVLSVKYKDYNKQGIRSDLFEENDKKSEKYNSRGRLAEEFDLSESTVFRLIALNDLDELLKIKIDNKEINLGTALEFIKLNKKDQVRVIELVEKYRVKLNKDLMKSINEMIEDVDLEEIIKSSIEEKEEMVIIKIPLENLRRKYPDIDDKKELKLAVENLFY